MSKIKRFHAHSFTWVRKTVQYVLILGAIVFASNAHCAPGGKTWDTHPFDLDKDVLLPNYVGHDPVATVNFLRRYLSPKSEYESKEDFASRLGKITERTIFGDTKASDMLAFSIPIDSVEYDANNKSMVVKARESTMHTGQRLLDLYPGFIFKNAQTIGGTYQVENLFGARRTVSKLSVRKLGVHFDRERQDESQTITVRFDVDSSEQARRLKGKNDLVIILIGHLRAPLIVVGDSKWEPDMNHLVESKEHAEVLIFNAENAWAVEKSTGKVLSKTFNLSRF